jgi:pilus assembly protein Flp/PilA
MLKYYVYFLNFITQPLYRDERGATAVEYGLMVALVAAVIVLTVTTLGDN